MFMNQRMLRAGAHSVFFVIFANVLRTLRSKAFNREAREGSPRAQRKYPVPARSISQNSTGDE